MLNQAPESAIISMPFIGTGITKRKAFSYGVLSGIVGAALGFALMMILDVALG